DKPTVKLTFGSKDNGVLYVRRESGGEKAILGVPDKLLGLVDQPPLAFLDRTLPSFSENAEVSKITLVRDGKTYEVVKEQEKSGAVWKLKQPADIAGRIADSTRVDGILGDLRGLRTTKLVAEKPAESDLKKWGLEPPQLKATVTVLGDDKKPKDWT